MSSESSFSQQILVDGVKALISGDRATAQMLLMQCVEKDERNEEAWLWLSGAVDELDDIETALNNVLDINPLNERARQGIEWIKRQRNAN